MASILEAKRWTMFDDVPAHITNLSLGAPNPTVLKKCIDALKTATQHRMDQPDSYLLFQYGPEVGDRRYREAVAKFASQQYQSPVDIEDVVATAGATHGLHILSHLLFSPGDIVFVENPTFFIAMKIFQQDAGLRIETVPIDEHGIIPEELEKVLEANKNYRPRELTSRRPYWGMLYTLACFQNPCGMCLPPDRCKKLIELARKYNILLVSDDVYNLIYHDKPPVRLFSYDKKSDPDYQGNAVSNASFSKIFGPGMRLGWMEAPPRVRDTILSSGLCNSGGGFNHTASGVMTSIIELGMIDSVLEHTRPMYQGQCEALCSALKTEAPLLEFKKPTGGFFIWVKLPAGMDGKDLLQLCREKYNLAFCPGEITSARGDFKDHIRLAYCHYDEASLKEAAAKLGKAIKSMMS